MCEKPLTCAVTVFAPVLVKAIACHPDWDESVLYSCSCVPLGTCDGSYGNVTVTGTANVVPCGVNANIGPKLTTPAGSGGAPALVCSIAIGVACASAPAGTTTSAPPLLTVPPAGPMPLGCGTGGDGSGDDPLPPQPARTRNRHASAMRMVAFSG